MTQNIPEEEDGTIYVPARAEDPEAGFIGDGLIPIGPDDPNYEQEKLAEQKREEFYKKYPHLKQ